MSELADEAIIGEQIPKSFLLINAKAIGNESPTYCARALR
jgi:hypothetical protein